MHQLYKKYYQLKSHVDVKYKRSLLKTMLNRAFKLSSNWQFFHQECESLKGTFARLHYQLSDLSRKIDADVHPVYTSHKIKEKFKPKEHKPPIVNQQNVVYYFKCGLCDADYVGYTSRHLHQRVEEHKRSTIGNHVKEEHGKDPEIITNNFKILKKCQSKFDCLIFEMLFIHKLKPKLNKQCDSIRAKLFV